MYGVCVVMGGRYSRVYGVCGEVGLVGMVC